LMFPCQILDRLKLIPSQLAFFVLIAAFHKVAMALLKELYPTAL
jgi:hypothetical protein